MPATPCSELLVEGAVYLIYGPLSTAVLIELALLARTLKVLNPGADTTPQALAAYGLEYACAGVSMADIIKLALLDQIYQSA